MSQTYEQYERGQEMAALGQVAGDNLRAILDAHNAENFARLARSAYKYTDCGASVGVRLEDGSCHYGDSLARLPEGAAIVALLVSSIIEGSEATTSTHTVNLLDETFETPAMAVAAYDAALEAVEQEAAAIWHEINPEE